MWGTLFKDGNSSFRYTSPWWVSEEVRQDDTEFVADDHPIKEEDIDDAVQEAAIGPMA